MNNILKPRLLLLGVLKFNLLKGLILMTSLVGLHAGGTPQKILLGDINGEVHAGGKYSIPTSPGVDFLNEGVDRVEALGSSAVKVWLTRNFASSYPDYSQKNPWPAIERITTLKQVLMLPQYQKILNRPGIKTYVFVANEMPTVQWKDDLQDNEKASVKNPSKKPLSIF